MHSPSLPVLCFPFAGAGAGFFRRWADCPTKWATIIPVQLPGREERIFEDPYANMGQIIDECVAQISPIVSTGPFAMFGHSFGALVAYETACYLVRHTNYEPAYLVVSGVAAPSIQRSALELSNLSDDEFIARLAGMIGYEHESLYNQELRELILPALRCDLAITDGYVASDTAALPVPISGLRGADDALVSAEDVAPWALATSKEFRYIEMTGDHMYLARDWAPLVSQIEGVAKEVITHLP